MHVFVTLYFYTAGLHFLKLIMSYSSVPVCWLMTLLSHLCKRSWTVGKSSAASVTLYVCLWVCLCLCVHTLKGKELELSTPNLTHIYSMSARAWHALTRRSKGHILLFSYFMLLTTAEFVVVKYLGGRKGIRPVKKLSGEMLAWLSGMRCRLAYSPVDATATHYLLLQ